MAEQLICLQNIAKYIAHVVSILNNTFCAGIKIVFQLAQYLSKNCNNSIICCLPLHDDEFDVLIVTYICYSGHAFL